MSSFVLVLPLEPLEVGAGFSLTAWPLHLTLVSNFASSLTAVEVGTIIADALGDARSFPADIGSDALFGRSENVRVSLVEPNPELRSLHDRLVDALSSSGAVFDDPDYLREGYRPHVTATKRDRVHAGDTVDLRQLALVDMAPDGDGRERRVVWARTLPHRTPR